MQTRKLSTGFPGLDAVLGGYHLGDNVVWNTPSVLEYSNFVMPFVHQAVADGKTVAYIRFANHQPVVPEGTEGVTVYNLDMNMGFEPFEKAVYTIASDLGEGACYVFDCLSELLSAWYSDVTVANFFLVTCPYLYQLDTIAHFAILKYYHSYETISAMRATTQVMMELYNDRGALYLHPQKAEGRHTPTLFLPHRYDGKGAFHPVTNSIEATSLFATLCSLGTENASRWLDAWDRLFISAETVMRSGSSLAWAEMMEKITRAVLGKDEQILKLARKHFTLQDLIALKGRMIGTGSIGGKAVGMLLARKILENDRKGQWGPVIEQHDSYYIGSDLFHTYIIYNGWWEIYMRQRTDEEYLSAGAELSELFLHGDFPHAVEEKFRTMMDYYGQYPVIVRSSSLLEDGYGNAFAGKYESFFCSVQGDPEVRFADFMSCVRRIYASAMSRDALEYRKKRGLQNADEQMALLVQRVSGGYHGHRYYPHIGGVGLSYNTYVWHEGIKPEDGMLRMVVGLGTHAVNRVSGDHPRIVTLSDPTLIPHADIDYLRRFSQRDMDVLDVQENGKSTLPAGRILTEGAPFDLSWVGVRDWQMERRLAERTGKSRELWLLTFEKLLKSEFPAIMSKMLKRLEGEYKNPVDIEFTLNFLPEGGFKVNVVQCRPLQASFSAGCEELPADIPEENKLIASNGHFMGGSMHVPIRRVISVDREKYIMLSQHEKYAVARAIGQLNRMVGMGEECNTILIGPGRWGTSTPSLGVPVGFAEICNMRAIAEVEYSAGGLMPELSFGSHFFQDLVESGIFYLALYPETGGSVIQPHVIAEYLRPVPADVEETAVLESLRYYEIPEGKLYLYSDIASQKVLCYHE